MQKAGDASGSSYTPLVGASVDIYSLDVDDKSVAIFVKSTCSDELGV